MSRSGRGWRGFKPKKVAGGTEAGSDQEPRLDRGRKVHGAKWVYVNERGEMLEYANIQAALQAKTLSKITVKDWILFKSRKEARRWIGLLEDQRIGAIRNLRRQVRLPLFAVRPDGLKEQVGVYTIDFLYERTSDGKTVYEETKGYREDLYLWKKKHAEIQYGAPILES